LKKAGTNSTVEVFPGTEHGFMFSQRLPYHPQGAEEAWTKLFDLWDRNLK